MTRCQHQRSDGGPVLELGLGLVKLHSVLSNLAVASHADSCTHHHASTRDLGRPYAGRRPADEVNADADDSCPTMQVCARGAELLAGTSHVFRPISLRWQFEAALGGHRETRVPWWKTCQLLNGCGEVKLPAQATRSFGEFDAPSLENLIRNATHPCHMGGQCKTICGEPASHKAVSVLFLTAQGLAGCHETDISRDVLMWLGIVQIEANYILIQYT